jgi:hypothetical protein
LSGTFAVVTIATEPHDGQRSGRLGTITAADLTL